MNIFIPAPGRQLSVTRADDREQMAQRIEAIVRLSSATVERDELMTRGRELWLHIHAPRGLGVTIDLDGDSQQQREGVFVLSWHMGMRGESRLSDAFGLAVGGTVNPHHRQKATGVTYSFDATCEVIAKALALADSAEAFERPHRATDAEIREELRNEIANSGDC